VTRYLLRRLAASLLLLLLLVSLVFVLLHAVPGDPLNALAGGQLERLTADQRARLERVYGLDRPIGVQYLAWLAAAARGDWGISISRQRPVARVIGEALPATVLLAVTAIAIDASIALPFGIWAARRRGAAPDRLVRGIGLLLYALPGFWVALMAVYVFAYLVPIFPASHAADPGAAALPALERFADRLHHLALPALVLGVATTGGTVRYVRNSLLGVLGQDYVRTARAKGLSERRVLWVHAMRPALAPVLQLFGVTLPALLNGVLVTEVIFSWPGIGQLAFQAIRALDYPLVLAIAVLSGALVIAGNLAADLLHAAADPRVRDALLETP
jgi:peptide/nickel transport system permease protein